MKLDGHLTELRYISAKLDHELAKRNRFTAQLSELVQARMITPRAAYRAAQANAQEFLKAVTEVPAAYQKMRKKMEGSDISAYEAMQQFIGDDLDEHPDVAQRARDTALKQAEKLLVDVTHSPYQTDARSYLAEAERLHPKIVSTLRERAGFNQPEDLGIKGMVDLDAADHPRALTDQQASALAAGTWLVRTGRAQIDPEPQSRPQSQSKPAEETASDWDMEKYVVHADKRDARIAAEREADKQRREDFRLGHGQRGIIHPTSAPSDPNRRHKEPAPYTPQNLSSSRYNFFDDESA
jgi:hypothetical protein